MATNNAVGRGILARDDQTRVLVAGSHRSGTTWVGGFLGRASDTVLLTEPFSRERGVIGVSHWFPYADGTFSHYEPLIDKVFLTRRAWFRPNIPGRSSLRAAYRYLFPDAVQRDYMSACASPPSRLVVKDPLASMAAEYLVEAYGFKVLFMVKHPCAFYDSLVRVAWDTSLPLEDLWEQSGGPPGRQAASRIQEPVRRTGLVWRIIYENALTMRDRYPDRVLILRHEDLCRGPEREFGRLADFCGCPANEAMMDYARATSSAEMVRPGGAVIHDLYRNSSAVAARWIRGIPQAAAEILRRETGAAAERLYPDW